VLPQAVKPSPAVEFDNSDPAIGAEISPEVCKIVYAVIDVMIGIAGKDQVDPGGWQQGIVWFGEDHFNVSDPLFLCPLCNQIVHLVVNVHRIDFAVGTDGLGKRKCKVTAAGTDVGNPVAGTDLKGFDDPVSLLPLISGQAFVGTLLQPGAAGNEEKYQQLNAD
jgi:hypothetical protein